MKGWSCDCNVFTLLPSGKAAIWFSSARIQCHSVKIIWNLNPYRVVSYILRTQPSLLCWVIYDQQTGKVINVGTSFRTKATQASVSGRLLKQKILGLFPWHWINIPMGSDKLGGEKKVSYLSHRQKRTRQLFLHPLYACRQSAWLASPRISHRVVLPLPEFVSAHTV